MSLSKYFRSILKKSSNLIKINIKMYNLILSKNNINRENKIENKNEKEKPKEAKEHRRCWKKSKR